MNQGTNNATASPTRVVSPAERRNGRLIMLTIAAISVLPLLAALYFRFVSPPTVAEIVGQPLTPTAFPFAAMQRLDGAAIEHPEVSGKWLMVFASSGACDERCRQVLYLTRQARTAQGRNMARLERVWVIVDGAAPTAELLAQHPDLVLAKAAGPELLPAIGGANGYHINLVDRRGMLVFRYADSVEPKAFIRELGKLIKF